MGIGNGLGLDLVTIVYIVPIPHFVSYEKLGLLEEVTTLDPSTLIYKQDMTSDLLLPRPIILYYIPTT